METNPRISYSPNFEYFLEYQVGVGMRNSRKNIRFFSRIDGGLFVEVSLPHPATDEWIKERATKIHDQLREENRLSDPDGVSANEKIRQAGINILHEKEEVFLEYGGKKIIRPNKIRNCIDNVKKAFGIDLPINLP